MENPSEQLCFVTIVFPITADDQVMAAKKKIEAALADLPKVKIELRLTSVRNDPDNGKLGH